MTTHPRLATGDLLLVQGAWWIRVFTGESVSHVGVLVRLLDGAWWVADYTWRHGYRLSPLAAWRRRYLRRRVWWGRAPRVVRTHPEPIERLAVAYRDDAPAYRWQDLPRIWWAQLIGRPYRGGGGLQCHTWALKCWRAAGYDGEAPRDPGDYFALCTQISLMEG